MVYLICGSSIKWITPLSNFKQADSISCLASAKSSQRLPSHPALGAMALTTSTKISCCRLQASQSTIFLVKEWWLAVKAGRCRYATPWLINYTGLTRARRSSYLPASARKFLSRQTWMDVYLQKGHIYWDCLTVLPNWFAQTCSFHYHVTTVQGIEWLDSLVSLLSWSSLVVPLADLWLVGSFPRALAPRHVPGVKARQESVLSTKSGRQQLY